LDATRKENGFAKNALVLLKHLFQSIARFAARGHILETHALYAKKRIF